MVFFCVCNLFVILLNFVWFKFEVSVFLFFLSLYLGLINIYLRVGFWVSGGWVGSCVIGDLVVC